MTDLDALNRGDVRRVLGHHVQQYDAPMNDLVKRDDVEIRTAADRSRHTLKGLEPAMMTMSRFSLSSSAP